MRFALQVETKNLITDANFRILARWIGLANRPLQSERQGAFLLVEGQKYRLPEPLFSLCEAIDTFAMVETTDYDSRMARLAQLQSLIPKDAQNQLAVDSYFASFRIMHASAFSLSLKVVGRNFDFDPILFGRRVIERAKAENLPIGEAESLLTDHQQRVFAEERFRSSDEAKLSYVIERGIYVLFGPFATGGIGSGSADAKRRCRNTKALCSIAAAISQGGVVGVVVGRGRGELCLLKPSNIRRELSTLVCGHRPSFLG